MPVYSFGLESPVKFNISDKLAQQYNEAADLFFKAQQRFNQRFGRQWVQDTDYVSIGWSRKHQKAWNQFGKVLDKAIEENSPVHPNDFMEDFLVKNMGPAVRVVSNHWGVALPTATMLGALHGLLRGR